MSSLLLFRQRDADVVVVQLPAPHVVTVDVADSLADPLTDPVGPNLPGDVRQDSGNFRVPVDVIKCRVASVDFDGESSHGVNSVFGLYVVSIQGI